MFWRSSRRRLWGRTEVRPLVLVSRVSWLPLLTRVSSSSHIVHSELTRYLRSYKSFYSPWSDCFPSKILESSHIKVGSEIRFPSSSLHNVLCDSGVLILREGTPFDWSHSLHRRSPCWDFSGFSSAVRKMPRYLCITSGFISLSPYHWLTDVTNVKLGENGPDRIWWHLHISLNLLKPQPLAPFGCECTIRE